jgi:hypothetical protein
LLRLLAFTTCLFRLLRVSSLLAFLLWPWRAVALLLWPWWPWLLWRFSALLATFLLWLRTLLRPWWSVALLRSVSTLLRPLLLALCAGILLWPVTTAFIITVTAFPVIAGFFQRFQGYLAYIVHKAHLNLHTCFGVYFQLYSL